MHKKTARPPILANYGSISSALHVINKFLRKQGKVVAVLLDPASEKSGEINTARVEDIQVMTLQQALNAGYKPE